MQGAFPSLLRSLCLMLCPVPLQAQARCHRIGQSKAVKVYRLITRNSYEREMFDKASLKLGLDKAVLQDINRKGSTNGVGWLAEQGQAECSPLPCKTLPCWSRDLGGLLECHMLTLPQFVRAGCFCTTVGLGYTWCHIWVSGTEAPGSPSGSVLK